MENHCKVNSCPALRIANCPFGYCSIHSAVAHNADLFDKALAGKLTAMLKEFALDVERGIYPRKTW